jgi:hypothetical protein
LNCSACTRRAIVALTFAFTLAIRVRGVHRHFWLLGDQIRDWSIALGPLTHLPLVGPATHVGGYTVGPAFYWILWLIRIAFGPWFQNLPHAGGIGEAALQSAGDALLLMAVWRRTQSVWIALTTVVLVASSGYDLCLSALVWNPPMGAALAKIATALVLLEWPERSSAGAAATAAAAWCAVQSYTGAIFVAVGVFAAILAGPFSRRDWARLRRNAFIISAVVALLQLPYMIHQISTRFQDSGMGAVAGSVGRILRGEAPPQLTESWVGYFGAFNFIQVAPWSIPWSAWVLLACGAVVAVSYRRDLPLLAITLLPQIAALIGYALYIGDFLDHYYYFSLMPAAVLTILLGVTGTASRRFAPVLGVALFVGALAIVPRRLQFGQTMHQMPEYGVLLDGSRQMARHRHPVRAVQADFPLPGSTDPAFLYMILGGHLDPASPFVAVIKGDGSVAYQLIGGT